MLTYVKRMDPRVKRTHQLLQQALLELMQAKRFASITVHDIAARARLNRATFYAHFEDKFHLLDALIREQFQQEMASTLSSGPSWGVGPLRALTEAVFDFLRTGRCQWKPTETEVDALFEQIVREELEEVLLSWLKQVPDSGMGQRVSPATMASVMSWAIFGAAAYFRRGARTSSREQRVTQVLIVLTEGVLHLTAGHRLLGPGPQE